jgi:hypothetical protein
VPNLLSSVTAQALAPELSRLSTVTMLRADHMRVLETMRAEVVSLQVENAPTFTEAPTSVERAYAANDGVAYFVPSAQVAKRSRATEVPHVFIDRKEGKYFLEVHFVLIRNPAVQADATPLALTDISARLQAPSSGQTIAFTTCQEMPAAEDETDVVKRVFCKAEVDPNVVTTILQEDEAAWFDLQANVHYRIAAPPATDPGTVVETARPRVVRDHRRRAAILRPLAALRLPFAAETVATPAAAAEPAPVVVARPISGAVRLDMMRNIELVRADLPTAPPASPVQSTTVSLTNAAHDGVRAIFRANIPSNRPIYALVTSSFGTNPSASWVDTQWGPFTESPIPDQFYFLPDDYRLAFDVERGGPAMFVLLVPTSSGTPPTGDGAPAPPEASGAPATISSDYRLRCRFGIAPWFDSTRIEALREEIASRTGIAYPELVIGGTQKATFGLSAIYESLGSEVLGDSADTPLEVDPRGFELVLDSTNEFYNLLARMLVTEGLEGEVELTLGGGDEAEPRLATRPVRLRLDQPALNFLSTRFERGDETDPEASPKVVVTNPSNVDVAVGSVRATLLVMDADMPSPIKAVRASATPARLTLDAASESAARTELEVTLAPEEALPGAPWGGVAVSFADVKATLDPEAMLAKAHELGASTDLKSSVVVRSYQLEHPDTLPESHKDVFGLEVQLRRGEAEPVTLFVTRDEPQTTVQVSFSLADIMAGANPEQPKFSWRRRNMAGSGTGEWSEWETIVGQQLFAAPVGL